MIRLGNIIKELVPYIAIILIVIIVRSFIVTPVIVDGSSMNPSLSSKDIMLQFKLVSMKDLNRFDIIILEYGNESLIKRLIGLPGETVEIKDNIIYINNEPIEDVNGVGTMLDYEKITLKVDEYYVLGDNRESSKDSRYFGPIKKDSIKGKTSFVVYPFQNFGTVD